MQLLINLISMTIFPFVAKPMIQIILVWMSCSSGVDHEQRKKEIPRFIIDAIKK